MKHGDSSVSPKILTPNYAEIFFNKSSISQQGQVNNIITDQIHYQIYYHAYTVSHLEQHLLIVTAMKHGMIVN